MNRAVADRERHDGDVAVARRNNFRLRQLPFGVVQLGGDLRHGGIDPLGLGIECDLGVHLRGLGGCELEACRLDLILSVLLAELGGGLRGHQRLHVGETLAVELQLSSKTMHVCGRLVVIRLELLRLLLRRGQRRLELLDLVLERRRVDLE